MAISNTDKKEVTHTYIFFEEGCEANPEFVIKATHPDDAYDLAYASYGPQIDDLFYKEAIDVSESLGSLMNIAFITVPDSIIENIQVSWNETDPDDVEFTISDD